MPIFPDEMKSNSKKMKMGRHQSSVIIPSIAKEVLVPHEQYTTMAYDRGRGIIGERSRIAEKLDKKVAKHNLSIGVNTHKNVH